jgi:hypothetical protein
MRTKRGGGARGVKKCVRSLARVYNSIASTEMVGNLLGREVFLFCLLRENRFDNWMWAMAC